MTYFTYNPAFRSGLYRLDVLVTGQSIATTSFSIGAYCRHARVIETGSQEPQPRHWTRPTGKLIMHRR